ncbi:MMPL family transporter [Streptomyces albus subsp. chlorinus]|uniref:MMPL family transporter n=1 Tax=Streptomyces albus TaxID=1888 RepID=UPI00156D474E|nr:MMPL family transporter [Streptomyces albus]NSC21337.1 MMPL family transporter [Streptomyces albus subsp. chlorinus]
MTRPPTGSVQSGRPPRAGLAARLGGWSTRHRKTAVFGWLLFVVLAAALGGMAGLTGPTDTEQSVRDSARATAILQDAGIEEPPAESVMVSGPGKGDWRTAAAEVVRAVEGTGEVRSVREPLPSRDGRAALIGFRMRGDPDGRDEKPVTEVLAAVDKVRDAHRDAGVEIHQYGEASAGKWLHQILGDDFAKAEWTAVPLALGILLVAFGALVAALLPVALAITAFLAANGLLALVSSRLHIDETTNSVMLLMGLAVGVDYCLFYLRRERDERAAGHDAETALRIAAATSGRAVLVSGLTVMVAMAGMFLSGLLLFKGFAVATILVVLIAMLGSVTILPALLSWLGDRVNAGRVPFLGRRRGARGHRSAGRVSGALLRPVLAAPGLFAVLAAVVMLALAAPALGMRTEQLSLDKQMPEGAQLRVSAERIAGTFPGGPAPARVVLKADDVRSAGTRAALADFTRALRADGEHFGRGVETEVHAGADVAVIDVPLAGDGTGSTSLAALDVLRHRIVPETLEPAASEGRVYVTGELAGSKDFNDQLKDGIVPVFVFITAVTFLLMLVCFRSVPVALASIVLNLLSVGAAYGVMTAVFQHGWGDSLVGTEAVGAVESWMPLFVLVVLFGLSMDYHVFVVSRIREAHDRGAGTREAIREGVRATAGAVTGAAAIMVAVFAVFATLSMQDMKQMGVGLAVAVLLDATLVRMVLLPSVMMLLGERNWYLPRWLRGLPRWLRGLPRLEHGEHHGAVPAPPLPRDEWDAVPYERLAGTASPDGASPRP